MSDIIALAFQKFQQKMDEGILALDEENKIKRKKNSYDALDIMKGAIKFSPTSVSTSLDIGQHFETLVGKCARSVYFNYKDYPITNPSTPEGIAKMHMGNAIETQRQGYLKAADYLHGANTRFLIEIDQDFFLSIETDGLIIDTQVGNSVWECKSMYGNATRDVFGSKTKPGHPKWDYCVQMMCYLIGLSGKYKIRQYDGKEVKIVEPHKPLFCVNENLDRAMGERKMFLIFVMKETSEGFIIASPDDIKNTDPSLLRPGWYDREFDRVDYIDLKFSAILERARYIGTCLKDNKLPARQGIYQYSNEQVEYMYSAGLLSKSKYDKWKKQGQPLGDWQCRYCYQKDLCLGATPWIDTTVPADKQIEAEKKKADKIKADNKAAEKTAKEKADGSNNSKAGDVLNK